MTKKKQAAKPEPKRKLEPAALPASDDMLRPVCPVHYVSMKAKAAVSEVRFFYCPVDSCKESAQKLRDVPALAIPRKPHICRCGNAAIVNAERTTASVVQLVCANDICGYTVDLSTPIRSRVATPAKSIDEERVDFSA